MKTRGAVPRVPIEADIILALEAPEDGETWPGWHDVQMPPYVEIALAGHVLGLDEALSRWDAEVWGGRVSTKRKPSPGLTRESLERRVRELSAQIKSLPTAEVFRIVADLIDTKQWKFASQTAAYAVNRLERERPAGGDASPNLELVQ